MASENSFEVKLNSKGGHAVMPFNTIDPIVVGAQIILSIQTICSRKLNIQEEQAVITITEFITNGRNNIIPSEVIIRGDFRCFTEKTFAKSSKAMAEITAGNCLDDDISGTLNINQTYLSTINTTKETLQAANAANSIFDQDNVNDQCMPLMASEDFSNMLAIKQGCYALIGNGVDHKGGNPLHSPNYNFNDDILALGASYWIQLVINQLKHTNIEE